MLVVEDDPLSQRLLQRAFEEEFSVRVAADASEALREIDKQVPSVVLLDRKLPGSDGLELLERLRTSHPELPVIILTGYADVTSAVRAMQLGAVQYMEKPIDLELLTATVRAAVAHHRASLDLAKLMGPSARVRAVVDQVAEVAPTAYSVLLQGETGTGKELVAQAVHQGSPRHKRPFIPVDCGAIPENLLESELFGHERGAFTGADRAHPGFLRLANSGTLFLDELTNLPHALQAKLLRVVQERTVRPVGGASESPVDVRIIAASNRSLPKEVKAGRFRQDLYFRLAEFTIQLPPLRERRRDMAHLARRFLEEAAAELRRPPCSLDPGALALLEQHAWPGNVRELRNVLRRAVLASAGTIEAAAIASLLSNAEPEAPRAGGGKPPEGRSLREIADEATGDAERAAIVAALEASGGNRAQAARLLKIDAKTLYLKLKRYHLDPPDEG